MGMNNKIMVHSVKNCIHIDQKLLNISTSQIDTFHDTEVFNRCFYRRKHNIWETFPPAESCEYIACSCLPPQRIVSLRRTMKLFPEGIQENCRELLLRGHPRVYKFKMSLKNTEKIYNHQTLTTGGRLPVNLDPPPFNMDKLPGLLESLLNPIYFLLFGSLPQATIKDSWVIIDIEDREYKYDEMHILLGVVRDAITVAEWGDSSWIIDIPDIKPPTSFTKKEQVLHYLHKVLLPWYRSVFAKTHDHNTLRSRHRYNFKFLFTQAL